MNFSNFFIEKLTETDSSLALGSKKPATNPFLFQDIIKVCEQENAVQNAAVLEAGKTEPALEIFAPTEHVIKVSPEEFTSLTHLITSLISQNAELQPTETKHKIEDANITKLQFIVYEEKLVELASQFIDGTSFSLIPLTEINNSSEISKQLTVSYKSGSNKLSVTVNPIKVDENYTSKVINDEFSFVNKLIVNEGLLQNVPFSLKNDAEPVEEELSLIEDHAAEETVETVSIEEIKAGASEKVFYKAEIIKIEVPESESNLIKGLQSNNSPTELLNMLFQQNGKQISEGMAISNTPPSLFENIDVEKLNKLNTQPETKAAAENTQLPLVSTFGEINGSVNEAKTESKKETVTKLNNNIGSKSAAITDVKQQKDEQNFMVRGTKENAVSNKTSSASLNDLMDGLTDEEKSVFKNFAASGEIREIKYESNIKEAQTDSSIKISAKTTASVGQKISKEAQPSVQVDEETISGKATTYEPAKNDGALEQVDANERVSTSTKLPKQMEEVAGKAVTQEKTPVTENKTAAYDTFGKADSTKPAEVKENVKAESFINNEIASEKSVAQEKPSVVESKTVGRETFGKVDSTKPVEVKENVKVESFVNNEIAAEKPVAQEKPLVVESKTAAYETFGKADSTKPAEVKENGNVKPLNNVEVIKEKQTSVEEAATRELDDKEILVKKEESNNDKAATGEIVKDTAPKKVEGRPKLISKEEFLAAKTLNQAALPKVAVEEKTATEKVITPKAEVALAVAEETVETKAQTVQPETGKKATEVSGEGKLFVKVPTKASIKVDKSNKEEVETKPQTGNSLSKEVKANDAGLAFQKEEKIIAETAKTVSLKNEKGEQVAANVNAEVSPSTKEKTAQVKTDVETKEQTTVHTKETKQTQDAQTNQQSDKENSKSNSSETFKNHLNQAVTSDKNFEVENLKPQVEAKQSHEAFKTVKQHEILPEFSKLILQGEKQTMTLQLTPENLGKVKLTVDMIENQIVTKIEVENEQVKQFVQSNIEQLKQNMQSAGIPLTNVNVSLADDQKNQKVFTQKKKSLSRDEKEDVIEETKMNGPKKQMGYNTYEFTA